MLKYLVTPVLARMAKLKYPTLMKISAGLFLISFLLPDPIPFVDEILLGLVTLMLSTKKKEPEHVQTLKEVK